MSTAEQASATSVSVPVRRILFWVHIWVGLIFCLPFALLGLTGSVLVYEQPINNFFAPVPRATAVGTMQPLQAIIDAGAKTHPELPPSLLSLPQEAGDPAIVRLGSFGRGGGTNYQAFIDPVSLQVLDVRSAARSYWMGLAHDFHGQLLMGPRDGRPIIGWFGVGMLALGLSGIVLWWPRSGRLKGSYGVTKGARGWLLHRQLHGTAGITAWALFIVLSFSGIVICFPQTTTSFVRTVMLQGPSSSPPAFGPGVQMPKVAPLEGAARIDADRAFAATVTAAPGAKLVAMFLPDGRDAPFRLSLLPEGAAQGSPAVTAFIDPYRGEVLSLRDPWAGDLGDAVMIWQRPLHTGRGTNAVYRAAIFLVGLLPVLFAVTGMMMWWTKRQARTRVVNAREPLPEGVAAE